MKVLFYLSVIGSLLFISCKSDDDSTPNEPHIPVDQRYLSEITSEQGETMVKMEYHPDKTIKKIDMISFILRFEYNENGMVETLFMAAAGEGAASFTFHYDGDDPTIITSFKDADNEIFQVVYDPEAKTYSFQEDQYTYNTAYLNDDQNIKKIEVDDVDDQYDTNYEIFYDEGKYGSLHNANNVSLPIFLASPELYLLFNLNYNLSSVPFEEIIGGQVYMYSENEFDTDNFLKSSIATSPLSEQPFRVNYKYIQL